VLAHRSSLARLLALFPSRCSFSVVSLALLVWRCFLALLVWR